MTRRVAIEPFEVLDLEIGQKFKGGIVQAINRADLWVELTTDPFPGTVLRQTGVYTLTPPEAEVEESTCLDCGSPHPHQCSRAEEDE